MSAAVPDEFPPQIPPTIPAAVERAARLWPDAEGLVDGDIRFSFGQLAEHINEAARAFIASGLQPGDRAAIWAPNSARWIVAAFGLYAAGGVLVPINSRFKAAEAAHVLNTSKARFLFTVTDFLGTDYVEQLKREKVDGLEGIVVLAGPDRADASSFRAFLMRADGVLPAAVKARSDALGPEDLSDIIFTSGTTGKPKGAMLTHGASTRTYTSWSEVVGLRAGDRYLIAYPFFHTAGLKSGVLACFLTGSVIVPHPVFDAPSVMARVAKERITMLPGPPAIFQTLLTADLGAYDTSSLRLAVTGAAAVPVELVERLRSELKFASVVTGYGLTETTGTATMCRHDDDPVIIATTCGRAIPGGEVCVVSASGEKLPPGEPGEVLVRGYQVMKGYFGDPAATAATIDAEGWLHTGDVGVLDEAGNLRITDRIKDMFIVGGFNAYPVEIENVILGHPAISQAAVVGVPDDRLGEVGMAFVVVRPGESLDADAFLAWCRERMANFKVPRAVRVVDAFPLNATGKVLKFELRAMATG
ncbi:MAG TPA: FadD3 family acyl-CoA ligase [Frankiaceae bacterium]|nr:FadD3 family acyl-CoA ligase [Frankiaceae bacterium]